ncbi:aminodeoxychorismate lyase [Azomonas macrocytogenes]|uniref:aminodeoxychorismate lyase n=1 Tax=Azomonas macrocytogenes TaxID=69962 RepID=UPI001605AAC2|nr:aminodeoxychorismate lyase [Azomonas macrocytogenes]
MIWLDGRLSEGIAANDRGLAYGDGLFETIRVSDGQPRLFERHLQRLAEGCRRLQIPCDMAGLRYEVQVFASTLGEGVCKLILTRGSGLRGYAPPQPCQPRRLLIGSAVPLYSADRARTGICLFPCITRLAEQPLLAGLKHLNRLEQVLARAEWQDSVHAEGLMRDTSGRIVEAVFSNIFLVRSGRLFTPELARCGVAGVMRAEIIERAREAKIPVDIRDISFSELLQADEVFLCNSQYGVWPVKAMQEHTWPVGPLTFELQGLLSDLMGIT